MDPDQIRKKLENRESGLMEIKRHSAVLVPLVEREGKLCFLFELRSAGISQPGEVCFPGGRMEEGETPAQAALREVREELGIGAEDVLWTAPFDTLATYTNMAIHTVFGQIREEALSRIQASKAEVAEWFTIPVDWLAQNEPFIYEYRVLPEIRSDFPYDAVQSPDKYNWRAGTCTVPIWHYEGHCLWGMTARMVVAILKFLA